MQLAPLSPEDLEVIRGWRNEARETLRTSILLTQAMQSDFYRDVVCCRESPHRYWALVGDGRDVVNGRLTISRLLLGMGGLTNVSFANGLGEISLLINPALTRRGLGTAAVECLLEEAFDRMRLMTVVGEVYASNSHGIGFWEAVAKRYGAYTTMLPRRKWWAGRLWDSLYFSITVEKWAAARAGTSVP